MPGDRFIIRQFSPVVTIGGGVVLDAVPILRMVEHEHFLQILADGDPRTILMARIARRGHAGISMAQLVAETGWNRDFVELHWLKRKVMRALRIGELFVDAATIVQLQESLVNAVSNFHKKNSLVGGMAREALREQVNASPEVFTAAVELLVREKNIEVVGDLVRLPGHGVVMKDEEAESKKKIEDAFAAAGLKVPALHEVLAGLKVDKARAQKIVTLLLRDKCLVKISDELVFHQSALEELRRSMPSKNQGAENGRGKVQRIDGSQP